MSRRPRPPGLCLHAAGLVLNASYVLSSIMSVLNFEASPWCERRRNTVDAVQMRVLGRTLVLWRVEDLNFVCDVLVAPYKSRTPTHQRTRGQQISVVFVRSTVRQFGATESTQRLDASSRL